MKQKALMLLSFFSLCVCCSANSQDTLRLTLLQAETQFLQNNLQLLAEKYNIELAKAEEVQASLYPNPNIQAGILAYNPVSRKVFDSYTSTGQYELTIQQMILLAGKRSKQVQLAATGTAMASNTFRELLRSLQYSLRSSFYNALFLQNAIQAYDAQITIITQMDSSYQLLQNKGVVTLKDAVRIRSLLYSLKTERTALLAQMTDVQSTLRLLVGEQVSYIAPVEVDSKGKRDVSSTPLQQLLEVAYESRNDLKLAQNTIAYHSQNYRLQKALAVPDLFISGAFDKRGGSVDNSTIMSVGIDLPFFNRNQGRIKAAQLSIEQSKLELEHQKRLLESEVSTAYMQVRNSEQMLATIDATFSSSYEKLLTAVTENFQKRNISLLEFTDFYDSYRETILRVNQLQNDHMQAVERLNYSIGKILF